MTNLSESVLENAENTIMMFGRSHNVNLAYDEKSVRFLDDFINESSSKYNEEQRNKLVEFLGSFLGECVRRTYGGSWEIINNEAAIRFDENNAVFPFNKIRKQFENGAEDSILSFYQIIPMVFKLNK